MVESNERKTVQSDSLERCIGTRMRLLRELSGQTQSELADKLGVSFQQVQKYEKGKTRISAGRLLDISLLFKTDVNFFFEDYPRYSAQKKGESTAPVSADAETLELLTHYRQIKNSDVSGAVRSLMAALKN